MAGRSRVRGLARLLPVAAAAAIAAPAGIAQTGGLPARLTDREFWRLVEESSEPGGYFRSENLVSNEHTFQYVIPALVEAVRPGGVYLGVAPDQNFTYIAALEPRIAFIVDIRRGNLLQHLMYKALFELSADRADFVSRLFSKPRPPGLDAETPVTGIFAAYARVATSEELYRENLRAIREALLTRRGFGLSPADWEQLESIYFAFFWDGPSIRYSSAPMGFRGRGFGGSSFPTWEELMLQTDWDGVPRSYLSTEARFRFVKRLQERNLLVPVVGDFAGPKALRAVGRWVRDRGATVGAFYVSNVEQYLFQDGLWPAFARNVATLPLDETSTFIRSVSSRFGYAGTHQWTDGRASALDPIRALLRDFEAGRVGSYYDLNARSREGRTGGGR